MKIILNATSLRNTKKVNSIWSVIVDPRAKILFLLCILFFPPANRNHWIYQWLSFLFSGIQEKATSVYHPSAWAHRPTIWFHEPLAWRRGKERVSRVYERADDVWWNSFGLESGKLTNDSNRISDTVQILFRLVKGDALIFPCKQVLILNGGRKSLNLSNHFTELILFWWKSNDGGLPIVGIYQWCYKWYSNNGLLPPAAVPLS